MIVLFLSGYLEQELRKAGTKIPVSSTPPPAPLPKDALRIQEESEELAKELREVSGNRQTLRERLRELREYANILRESQRFTGPLVSASGGVLYSRLFLPSQMT